MHKQPFYQSTAKFIAAIMIVMLALAVLPVMPAYAATCTSTGSGNWSAVGTWSCGHVPNASDDAMIANGQTITFDLASATVNSLTINDGNATTGLTIGGTNALTVTNNVLATNSTNLTTKSIDVGAGTLNVGGNLTLSAGGGTQVAQLTIGTGTVTVNGNINATVANAKVIFSGAGTLNVGGNYTNGGTLTPGTGTINYNGAAQTVGSYVYNNLNLSGSGVKTLQAGTTSVTGNLTLSGTATATTAANLAIGGNLNVSSGTAFATGTNYTLGVTGSTTIDGTLTLAGTGAKTFTGDVAIDSGGTWNETGVAAINYAGSLAVNGTYTANTGTHTFSGGTKTIGGANLISIPTATFTGAYTNSGSLTVGTALTVTGAAVRLTNNGTITASAALSGTGGVTQGTNATLNLRGTSGITTLTATATGNMVNYNGAGAQTVKATAYDYLILSGSGVKTMNAGTSVNTNLNIIHAGGATVSIAAGQLLPVNSLAFDGVGQVSGTWGSSSSTAAHQNNTYFAATTGRLNVATTDSRTIPVITFGTAPTPTYLGGNFTVSASTTNTDNTALTYSVVSGPCALVGGATFSSSSAGTCVVQANGAATTHFEAASATQSITIAKANQAALTVASTPSTVVQGYSSTLSSSGGSGTGAVTYSVGSSTGCAVAGSTLTVTNASGTCSVSATKAGDANFLPATSAALPIKMALYESEINKSFSPISILPGDTARLSITIYNPNIFQLINEAWSDNLVSVQPGISLASPVNLSSDCGGSVSAVAGGTSISLSGGTVPAKVSTNGSCTVAVDITSTTAGNLINTIPAGGSTATDSLGNLVANTTPASATLQVTTVLPPSVNKNFNANTIWAGANSVLTINFVSTDPNNALTQTSLTDTLPANVVISSTDYSPALTNCGAGASLSAPHGGSSLTLNNGTIGAGVGTTCSIKVNVTSTTQGSYINTIPAGAIQTHQGVTNAGAASATLNVQQLNLTKAFAPASIIAGGTSTATITLQNPTSVNYTNASLADSLPAGMTVTGTPTTTCFGGAAAYNPGLNQVTLTGATIPTGTPGNPGTCKIVFTVTTPATAGSSTLTNSIPAGSLHDDQNVSNPTTVSTNLTVTGELTVAKAISPSTITAGNPSTVTITLSNHTAAAFTGVNMTDILPVNLTVYGTPTTPQCPASLGGGAVAYNSGTNTLTLSGGTIPPGSCTVVFQVTSSVAGTYTNSIASGGVVATGQGISNVGAVNSNVLTVQASAVPVTGSKSFTPASILPGANTDLTINVIAPSDTNLTNVSVTDALPAGVTISNSTAASKSANCSGGSLSAVTGTGTFSWSGGSINGGLTCTLSVWVTSSTPGTITNTITPAQITDDQGRTLVASISAALNVSNLQVSKAFYPTTINPNGSSTLTITLTNTNTSALTSLNVTDSLATMGSSPNNVVVAPAPNASTSCGGSLTALAGASSITLTGGIVPAQVGTIAGICTINVDVQGKGATGTRTNTIPTSNVSASLAGVPISPLAQAQAQLSIAALSITVNKAFSPLLVYGGSVSTLSVQLTNPNNALLTGIAFTDAMPAGMIIATPANLNTDSCGGTLTGVSGASTFSFSGGSLAANATCTLTLSATTTVNGDLTNAIPIGAVTTFNGASNPMAAQATLTNLPGVSVSKAFSPNPVPVGSVSTLTLTIKNTGSTPLTAVALPDILTAGLVIAASPAPINNCGGSLSAVAGTQTIQLTGGGLAASSSCMIVVPVTGNTPGNYVNTIPAGKLTDTEGATNTEDATDTLTLVGPPTIAKSFADASIALGATTTLTFTLTNPTGNTVPLTGVGFSDPLPSGLSVATPNGLSGACGGGTITATAGSGVVSLTGATLAASNGSCTFSVNVIGTSAGLQSNTTGNVTSANGGNGNSATANVTVVHPQIAIAKTPATQTIVTGGTANFTLTVTNPGDVPLNTIVVTDPTCTTGPTYVSGDTNSDGILQTTETWTYSCSVTGQTSNFSNTADVSGMYAVTTVNANATANVTVVAPPSISKTFTPATIVQSDTSSLGFTIANPNTATALTGVAFTDILPSGLSVATSSTTVCIGGTLDTTAPATIVLSGGSIAAGGNCSFDVTVTGTTAGHQTNTTGNVTSTNGGTGNTASATLTVAHLFDPPTGVKTVDSSGEPLLKWTLVWINDSNIVGVKAVSHDPIPAGTTFTPNAVDSGHLVPVGAPAGSTSLGVACTAGTSVLTVTTLCYYEGPTLANPRGQIIWAGTLGPDFGVTNPSLAVNAIHITFSVTAGAGVTRAQNQATIDWDRNGNGVTTDPGEEDVASASVSWTAPAPVTLPLTGFAPGAVTSLAAKPDHTYDTSTDLTIEIPALVVRTTIVGIPEADGTWDVSWLGDQVGYLEETAFPTWSGNSVVTGHVYGPDGLPGPFVNLKTLKWGDQVIIHFAGQRYIFEVRTNEVISPTDTSIFSHKDYPWLTLLTCKDYNVQTNSYAHRVAVGAVLIKTETDPPPGP